MFFRVGVNLGDVMVGGDNLFGDGVNVAAPWRAWQSRVGSASAEQSTIRIRNQVDLRFDDLGERSLKNIGYPVRVFGVR